MIIIDVSGFSNKTYIVALKSNPLEKIVVRIFMCKTSDFEAEAQIFRLMGLKGLGPKEFELT